MIQTKDQSLLKLVNFFVSKHNYSFVQVQDVKNEVWLANPEHPTFPIIRVSPSPINATFFDKERIKLIYTAIASHHKVDKKLLDIHTKVEEEEDYDEEFIQVSINEKTSMIPEFLSKAFSDIKMAFSSQTPNEIKREKPQRKSTLTKKSIFSMIPPVTMVFMSITFAVFIVLRLLMLRYEDPVALSVLLGSIIRYLWSQTTNISGFLLLGLYTLISFTYLSIPLH